MMQDFDRTLELSKASANSYGATLAQSAEYMEGLQAKITLLKNAWEKLVTSEKVTNILIGGVKALTAVINTLSDNFLQVAIPAIALFLTYQGFKIASIVSETKAQLANIAAKKTSQAIEGKGLIITIANAIIAHKAKTAALKEETAATVEATAAQNALNASMLANPYFLVAIAIIAALTVQIIGLTQIIKTAGKTADDYANKGIEKLKELQVELYNVKQSAEKIDSLANSFDELSKKINKSTEDLEELKNLANQINEEAGQQIVDTSATVQEQRATVQAYNARVQMQLEQRQKSQAQAIGEGYSESLKQRNKDKTAVKAWSYSLAAVINPLWLFGLLNLNSLESDEEIKNAYLEKLKTTDAGKTTVKQALIANNDVLKESSAAVQSFVTRMALDTLTTDDFNKEGLNVASKLGGLGFNNTLIKELDDTLQSTDLNKYWETYGNLDKKIKENIEDSGTLFTLIKSMAEVAPDNVQNLINSFNDLEMSIETIDLLMRNLGKEATYDNISKALSKARELAAQLGYDFNKLDKAGKQSLFGQALTENFNQATKNAKEAYDTAKAKGMKTGADVNEYQRAMTDLYDFFYVKDASNDLTKAQQMAKDTTKTSSDLKNKLVKQFKAKYGNIQNEEIQTLISELANSANLDDLDEIKTKVTAYAEEVAKTKVIYENATEAQKEFYDSLDVVTVNDIIDSITTLSSRMENLNKINSKTLTGLERLQMMQNYPELADSIAKGVFSVGAALSQYQKEFANTLAGIRGGISTDSSKMTGEFTKLTDDEKKSYASQIRTIEEFDFGTANIEDIQALITNEELKGLRDAVPALDGYINEIILLRQQEKLVQDIGWTGFIDLGREEMEYSTDAFKNVTLRVSQLRTELGRLVEGTDEYIAKEKELSNLQLNQLATGAEKLQELRTQQVQDILDGTDASKEAIAALQEMQDKGYLTYQDGKYILSDTSFLEGKTDEQRSAITLALGLLADTAAEIKEVEESLYSTASDMATQLTDKLQKQRDAYEEYFDEIDKLEEEEETETERNRLLSQIQSLTGAFDSTSKSRLKELKKQLQDLEKQQLEMQREEERNSLLSSIDKQIENASNAMKMLTAAILSQQSGKDYSDAEKTNLINALNYLGVDANTRQQILGFSNGGYVKDTGLVMVHGSQSRPEAFLDAVDTQNMRILLDTLQQNLIGGIRSRQDAFDGQNNISIGQISIQTNQLNNAQDFGEAGKALAQEFSRAIQQRGINVNVKR